MSLRAKFNIIMGAVIVSVIILMLSMQLINAQHKIMKLQKTRERFLVLSKSLAVNPRCADAFLDAPWTNEELSTISQFEMPS